MQCQCLQWASDKGLMIVDNDGAGFQTEFKPNVSCYIKLKAM